MITLQYNYFPHLGPSSQPISVNQDLLEEIKGILLEICMKVSTENHSDLLILYSTVVQAMFTHLSEKGISESNVSSYQQQFDFLIVVSTMKFDMIFKPDH